MSDLPYVPPPEKDDSAEGFVRIMVGVGLVFVVACCILPLCLSIVSAFLGV